MYDSYAFVERMPYLQMQTTNSIVLKWQTPKKEIGCVTYTKNNTLYHDRKICDTRATKIHRIQIDNLKPDTSYNYSVLSDSLEIDNSHRYFSTLSIKKDATQRILVFGDSGKRGKDQTKVYNEALGYLKNNKLNLWLLLGDNAYRSGTQEQYNKNMFEPYKEVVKYLVPWAINGNHDARRLAFYNIFEFPTNAESGGVASGSEKFYAIDSGNLHLVMLDSQSENLGANAAMAKWLEKDLAQVSQQWIVVAFHHPPYTDGSHNSDKTSDSGGRLVEVRQEILPILEKYGVDLVLSGHSHGYERSKLMHKHYQDSSHFNEHTHLVQNSNHNYKKYHDKTQHDGTIYNVIGSSAKVDNADYKHPALPFSYAKMGSVLLTITNHELKSEFITIDGDVQDYFSITKE
jgi:phosphodiesterase/alkaline phosphatase D-like protein